MLRPYQQRAVEAVYRHLRERDDNPVVVLPTGSGKSWVMAQIAADATQRWHGRVLILAHRRELLQQNADKLQQLGDRLEVGLYSAGLKRQDRCAPVLVAGIQSIWNKVRDFDPFDLVIVDECHLLPEEGDGLYRSCLAEARRINPHVRIIGFTATPFRLRSGPICTPDGFLNHICYEVGVRELIVQGYLCPLVTKAGQTKVDTGGLRMRGGEYVAGEVEELMDRDALVEAACAEIVERTQDRKAVLIFASGIRHGEHIVRVLRAKHGIESGFVTGETPARERDVILARFRGSPDGQRFGGTPLKYLVSVDVLTTGFDAPNVDCVVLLRPTLSPGLYYQMVGRGFRLHSGKQNCLVLDFGGNVLRHGPVDGIKVKERTPGGCGQAPAKECPECHSVIAAGYARCPDCGYEFPPAERSRHDAKASEAGILSGQVTITQYAVRDVYYGVHKKRDAPDDAPRTMRVDYKVGWHEYKSEWVCFEHTGYARAKAVAWWRQRSYEPVPETAEEAVALAQAGRLAPTREITVRSVAGEDFDRIIGYELGDIPLALDDQDAPADAIDFPFGYNAVAAEEEIPW